MNKLLTQAEWNFWYDKVFGYFLRRVGNRYWAEELTAKTLNDFFLSEKDIEQEKNYLWGIARNKFYDYLKEKRRNHAKVDLDDLSDLSEPDLNYNLYFQERITVLQKCIDNHLKAEDREILDLSIKGDFKCSFIAKELGLKHTVVRKRLSRSIQKIRAKCRQFWSIDN